MKVFWRGPFLYNGQSLISTHLKLLEGGTTNANILVALLGLLLGEANARAVVPFLTAIATDHEAIVRSTAKAISAKHLLELLNLLGHLDEELVVFGDQFLQLVDWSLALVVVHLLDPKRPASCLPKGIAKGTVLLADNVECIALVDDLLRLFKRDDIRRIDERLGFFCPCVGLVYNLCKLFHRLGA